VKLVGFLFHYLRRYWRWALLALTATLVYAAATVLLIQLIQAIFGEVLRFDGQGLPGEVAGLVAPAEPAGPAMDADGAAEAGQRARVFLDRWLNDGYERMKGAFGIHPGNVVVFVPVLFAGPSSRRAGSTPSTPPASWSAASSTTSGSSRRRFRPGWSTCSSSR
jgi:hypothetical protein